MAELRQRFITTNDCKEQSAMSPILNWRRINIIPIKSVHEWNQQNQPHAQTYEQHF